MENQAKSKLIKEEFFQQMKTSLQGAPEDITYIVLAIENPEGERRLKEGIVSMQGSSSDLTFLLSQAFKRAPEIKEVVSEAVDFRMVLIL